MKFVLSKGLKYSQINELIQRAIVEESIGQIKGVNKEVSVSKIALISGVHRSRVKEILELGSSEFDLQASTLSKILGYWSSSPEFLGKDGQPKSLSTVGIDSEFSKLVLSITKQISPYTVLFELKRIGAVEVVNEKVKLIIREYWTGHSPEETYTLVSRNIESLLSAVDENLNGESKLSPQLHLTTEYDNIVESKIPEIKAWLLDKGNKFHKEVSSYFAKFDKDINKNLSGIGEGKVSVTIFSFANPKLEITEIKPNKRGRKKKNV